MTGVVTRMNGLQVVQTTNYSVITNANTFTNPPTPNLNSGITYFEVATPLSLATTMFSGAQLDDKFYFRQQKIKGYVYNHSNAPVLLEWQYMTSRRNISIAEYPTLFDILGSRGPSVADALIEVTTSNNAQRYMKFMKKKSYILNPNRMRRFTLRSIKTANKQVSRDTEGNGAFLGTKYFSRFVHCKISPVPLLYRGNVPPNASFIGTDFGPFAVQFMYTYYTSWYKVGQTDPTSLYADQVANPISGAVILDIQTEQQSFLQAIS